jgi:GntR family transcriptional regulator/MocR family aminotransferase
MTPGPGYDPGMRRWELTVALDTSRDLPLFLQLASAISDAIRHGRLKPGDPLPGTRLFAEQLGVNRNTVVAGYGELAAEGLIRARPGGGTFVAELAAAVPVPPMRLAETPTYALAPPVEPPPRWRAPAPGVLTMRGVPDARLFPARVLARAFRRAIEHRGHSQVSYGDACGHIRLRTELATMLSRARGLPASPHNVMVTRSLEQGIDLVARTLIAPGDVVAIERFGYPPVWSMLKLAGARLAPLPLDEDGLDIYALEEILKQQRIRAVFLTPHHQFPTTVVMSHERRVRLAELARVHHFAIIEDDYDHEFHYEGRPVLPVAAAAGGANVIYIGSLANLLAPGIGTGFVVAPPPVFERLACLRAASDPRCDAAMECAIAELFEDGELLRHVRRMRRIYAGRRDALAGALRRQFADAIEFRVPEGGMALWLRADDSINVADWVHASEREGVSFDGGQCYDCLHREQPYVRLGFTRYDETQLEEAVRRMARALSRVRRSHRLPQLVS